MRPPVRTALIAAAVTVAAVLIYVWLRPAGKGDGARTAPTHGYRVVNTYPHDTGAFTQGLVFKGSVMYEGTGLRGRSSLREVDLETGDILRMRRLPDEYFGEGITICGDRIIQLTLTSRTGFVYHLATFDLLEEFEYTTGGWGITCDGERLIMSDGTSMLHFLDPATFQRTGQVIVRDGARPVIGLNELEYVDGEVFANVWQTDLIARISPGSGEVTAWIDLTGILSPGDRVGADVLNGIAYDAGNRRLFVTGKLWPNLYEIELIP